MKFSINRKKLIYISISAALLIVGGPWLYTSLFRDEPLNPFNATSISNDGVTATTGEIEISGDWKLIAESQVGYRIKERIALKTFETVGRSSEVTGSLKILDSQITQTTFEVDMKTFQSDSGGRDAQFNGRIMDTEKYPTANFVLTEPITLVEKPINGSTIKNSATGNLTLRGTTKEVTIPLSSTLQNSVITVIGQIQIQFDEWKIPNPSVPLVFIYTEPNCILEFSLKFEKQKD
jgi:polyisoprenoid-binding protein YceI